MHGRTLVMFAHSVTAWSAVCFGSMNDLLAAGSQSDVAALLANRCVQCHGPGEAEAGLRLDVRKSATTPLESGNVAIVPGAPDDSELLKRLTAADNPMPPEGELLTASEIELVRRWIDDGAEWQPHWAYRDLTAPAIPTFSEPELSGWVQTPIDAFVLRGLVERGLKPSASADRRRLLRRVYYDLIGLPPTPAEMHAFVNDASPDAYAHVVDALLARPQYGERWARHWMDVVHYADTHGFEHDIYRDSWPYRDYLIQSFNADKPYARFVQEQVAGDVLFPDNSQALVATGFLATGPWDLSALQSGNPESIDHLISQYLDRDDIVSTVMSTFVSSTVQCARCHDHKFDPISQAEYYSLQAVFAGIDKATRTYDPDPAVTQRRTQLETRKAEIETNRVSKDASLLESPYQEAANRWAASLPAWTLLEPHAFASAEGATLVKEPDGSLLSTGKLPETDTYTVRVESRLQRLAAIRVELLADARLPSGGPGRQENGNLHINELVLSAAPLGNRAAAQQVALKSAWADFDQEGWEVAKSIDKIAGTAWGIHPQVGKSHVAVYVLEEPLSCEAGLELTVQLSQTHGRRHLVGRFRLAATDVDDPNLLVRDLNLKPILETPPAQRSQEQQMELVAHYLSSRIDRELSSLPEQQPLYCGTNKFTADRGLQPAATPRPIHVLTRGSVGSPGPLATPGTISCVPGLPAQLEIADLADEGARRAALAQWLSSDDNVLTWRGIVNRIWHFHFGRGLVATPNDFGQMGTPPTHPELLDWLAVRFRENGGSLKWLHRLLVTSKVYQQSSRHHAGYSEIDSENRYLWRMQRQLLDAESIRDTLLQHSGKLDPTMGGPPVKQFVETKKFGLRAEADYGALNVDDPGYYRRSVYRYVCRTMPDPFMNAMDCPDASRRAPVRNTSITALQAAAMLNDPFLVRQCEHISERLASREAELSDQITAAYQLLYGRSPQAAELDALWRYATQFGMANACRVLLNTNEFLFVD